MCGIFGFIVIKPAKYDGRNYLSLLKKLCLLSETRGKDSSGFVYAGEKNINVLKRPFCAQKLLKSSDFVVFQSNLINSCNAVDPFVVMGHTRMATNGKAEIHDNNQPVVRKGLVCIHNGIVLNDGMLWKQFPELKRQYEVDTEIVLALMEMFQVQGQSLPQALCSVYQRILGANSIALISSEHKILSLATTNGSLFMALSADCNIAIFASEKYILSQALRHVFVREYFSDVTILQVMPRNALFLEYGSGPIRSYFVNMSKYVEPVFTADRLLHPRTVCDDMRPVIKSYVFYPMRYDYTALERLCRIEQDRICKLKRCAQCLLPETFPFISFDKDEICNYCHDYKKKEINDRDSLNKLLAQYRRNENKTDCLIPFSGGRDSSYVLHYVKKELGLNPIAYSYDWGMITDLARRNISRMCGTLGIEHILISANINQKRANIRKNVLAWLRRPNLGMVPLFMAGDKQFFYYANLLMKQNNISISILGENLLETTKFKSGFCGIKPSHGDKHTYSLTAKNKIKLLAFYAKEYLLNPYYLNASLLDTLDAFRSYYVIRHKNINLYDYIEWNESKIKSLLIKDYGWETDPGTKATWRIGDGTAAFYNYIYYTVAGFTENDTFRSNQIRNGYITREEALGLIKEENLPRWDSLKWYCDTIGIDFEITIKRINSIPKLYRSS
jgi:glutamine---fructose-6-phosphate transaminase (isomerizing)